MHTGQVAKLAYVDLKNFETRAAERERILHKCLRESIHLKSAAPLAASALLRFMFVRICSSADAGVDVSLGITWPSIPGLISLAGDLVKAFE